MARAHGTGAGGVELDLIGQPLDLRPGPAPGIHFVENEPMTKAPYDGLYLLNGIRFRMRAGKPLPEGAVPIAEPIEANFVMPGTEGIELGPSDGENVTAVAEGELADGVDLTETLIEPADLPEDMKVEPIEETTVEAKNEPAAPDTKAVPAAPENKAEKPPSTKAEKKGA